MTLFEKPAHPYTKGLFSSIPSVKAAHHERDDRLFVIPGMVPRPQDFPTGCRFRTRCRFATDKCKELPPLEEIEPGHLTACWYAREIQAGTRPEGEPHDPRSVEKETITLAGIDGSV